MSDIERTRLFRKKLIRPYRGYGNVYGWLRAHHARVKELVATWAWADLVEEMLRDGLQGRGGVTPTPKAVSKVWQRVCRDVEAEASAVKPKTIYPSRISPDWRPQVVQPPLPVQPPPPTRHPMPATAPAPAGSLPAGSSKPSGDGIVISPEAQARIDRAMERLAADDRKKFRFGG